MSRRTRLSNFKQLTEQLAGKFAEQLSGQLKVTDFAGQLSELLPDRVRPFVKNPRLVGNWLEEQNPWLGRQLLSAASNLADPYLAGMGLSVEGLTEESVEVSMPHRWRNRGEGGTVHVGALTTLAEFTSRLYWERHLNLNRHEMQVSQIQARFLRETESDTRAVMNFKESDREAALFRLRSEGWTVVTCQVSVYDVPGRLVAEATVDWRLSRPKAIGSGQA